MSLSELSPAQAVAEQTQTATVAYGPLEGGFEEHRKSTWEEKRAVLKTKAKEACKLAGQLLVLIGVYETGCLAARVLPIDAPGNILGMGLLLALLITGVLREDNIGGACDYLVDHMSIFFIPAGVGIMGCVSMLAGNILKFALVCVVTTVIVFLVTSYTVMLTQRLMQKHAEHADSADECNDEHPENAAEQEA